MRIMWIWWFSSEIGWYMIFRQPHMVWSRRYQGFELCPCCMLYLGYFHFLFVICASQNSRIHGLCSIPVYIYMYIRYINSYNAYLSIHPSIYLSIYLLIYIYIYIYIIESKHLLYIYFSLLIYILYIYITSNLVIKHDLANPGRSWKPKMARTTGSWTTAWRSKRWPPAPSASRPWPCALDALDAKNYNEEWGITTSKRLMTVYKNSILL